MSSSSSAVKECTPVQLQILQDIEECMQREPGVNLAAEMGIGKTVILSKYCKKRLVATDWKTSHIFVVPGGVIPHWQTHLLAEGIPADRIRIFRGPKRSVENIPADQGIVVLTTYHTLQRHACPPAGASSSLLTSTTIIEREWDTLYLDEMHRFRNLVNRTTGTANTSALANQPKFQQVLSKIKRHKTIGCTGTPCPTGHISNLASLVSVVFQGTQDHLLHDKDMVLALFRRTCVFPREEESKDGKRALPAGMPIAQRVRVLLSYRPEENKNVPCVNNDHMLRDTSVQVGSQTGWCDMERAAYEQAQQVCKLRRQFATSSQQKRQEVSTVLHRAIMVARFMDLLRLDRQVAVRAAESLSSTAEDLEDEEEGNSLSSSSSARTCIVNEEHVAASPKFQYVLQLLATHPQMDVKGKGRRVIICCPFTSVLRMWQKLLIKRGFPCRLYAGNVSTKKREEIVTEFQTISTGMIFLLSTKAGGEALHLSKGDAVVSVCCEPFYAWEEQGNGRVLRFDTCNIPVPRHVAIITLYHRWSDIDMYKQQMKHVMDSALLLPWLPTEQRKFQYFGAEDWGIYKQMHISCGDYDLGVDEDEEEERKKRRGAGKSRAELTAATARSRTGVKLPRVVPRQQHKTQDVASKQKYIQALDEIARLRSLLLRGPARK